jgi:hypothetical protein
MRPIRQHSAQIAMTVPGSRNTETASALRTMSHHGWTSKLASVGPADATAFSSVGRMAEN